MVPLGHQLSLLFLGLSAEVRLGLHVRKVLLRARASPSPSRSGLALAGNSNTAVRHRTDLQLVQVVSVP